MSEHWTSSDPRDGPRPVRLLMFNGAKALVRFGTGRATWVRVDRVHETREQAFIAARRAMALRYWQRKLRYEQERT